MKKLKEKALILKCTKYGEADLIVKALTQSGSQISLLARAALKSKKRFGGGVLEPTHFVELSYSEKAHGNSDRLGTLDEASLIDGFEELRKNYDCLEQALYIVECISKVSQENDMHSVELFNLVGNALRSLSKLSPAEKIYERFQLHFCLKLLFQQGVLEPEGWMQSYLKVPLADHQALSQFPDPQMDFHRMWAENKVREYLSTGMLTS